MSKGALKLTEELHRCSQPINDPELSKYSEAWLHAAQTIDNLSLELVNMYIKYPAYACSNETAIFT